MVCRTQAKLDASRVANPTSAPTPFPSSGFQHAPETPGGVIRLGAVVIGEDLAVAAVAEECATQAADALGRADPARCFAVELANCLQLAVLLLGQQGNA